MAVPQLTDTQFAVKVNANAGVDSSTQLAIDRGFLNLPDYVIGVITTDGREPAKDGSNWQTYSGTNLFSEAYKGVSLPYADPVLPRYTLGAPPDRNDTFRLYACRFSYTYFYYSSGSFLSYDDSVSNKWRFMYMVLQRAFQPDGSVVQHLYLMIQRDNDAENVWQRFLVGYDVEIILKSAKPPFGDESETTDENGNYDRTTTPIGLPELPNIDIASSGFISMWKPTIAQLREIGGVLWDNNFFNAIIKSYQSPVDAIIALNVIPAAAKIPTGTARELYLGNYGTKIQVTPITSQFFELDMGTLEIKPFWASALDYNPYTSIQLFLPYIGFVPISPDDVMGKTIHVTYRCEIVTGQIAAFIFVKDGTNEALLYSHSGNFAISVPITGANFGEIYKSAIQGAVGLVSGAASAVATGGAAGVIQGVSALGSATGNAVSGSKIQYERSGSISMAAGYMGKQQCYVVITRPRQSLAANYNKFVGYPSNITANLTELSGFTQVESIHLEGVSATDEEKEEIIRLLQEGVVI